MVVKACAVGIVCSVCALLLKELGWRAAPVFATISALAVISIALPGVRSLGDGITSVLSAAGASEVARTVLKIIGVGYLSGICADLCRDIGSERVGTAVMFAGRMEIAIIAMPYVLKMLKLGLELVE